MNDRKAYFKVYYEQHKEELNAYNKRYRMNRAIQRKAYHQELEKKKAYDKEYYQKRKNVAGAGMRIRDVFRYFLVLYVIGYVIALCKGMGMKSKKEVKQG